MKLNKIFIGLLIPIIAIAFSSCKKCIQGNNYLKTETRSLGSFNGIISNGDYKVFIIQDTVTEVMLDGDENILSYISTSLIATKEGTDLIIEKNTDRCIRTEYPIELYIRTPDIEYVELAGTGFIKCDSLETTNDLELVITGSGDIIFPKLYVDKVFANIERSGTITLKGECSLADLKITGSGNINAIQMETERCYAKISGSGDITTLVTKLLTATISGSGKISYATDYDGAMIEPDISGEGEIVPL